MNSTAEQHLAKAKDYVARGEEFYRKAAEEIVAALQADATLSQREVGEWFGRTQQWVSDIVRWSTSHKGTRSGLENASTPYAEEPGAASKRHAKLIAKKEPEALIEDPETRASLTRALDEHYTKQADTLRENKREREVERKGGEDEHAEYERRQRVGEVVSVARGAASALKFVAGQVKPLGIAEDDSGVSGELAEIVDEISGFVSLLRSYLGGGEITDEQIAALIGGDDA